jgi:hypothetical protein
MRSVKPVAWILAWAKFKGDPGCRSRCSAVCGLRVGAKYPVLGYVGDCNDLRIELDSGAEATVYAGHFTLQKNYEDDPAEERVTVEVGCV